MRRWVALICLALGVAACSAGDSVESVTETFDRPDWGEVFERFGVEGTFAVRGVGAPSTAVFDQERAEASYLPASTFKILNSLIILETGEAADVDEVVEWDGIDRGIEVWNQPHSLRSGIEVSAVWLYQHHARAVGAERMAELVSDAGYGNADIGGEIDRFWLDGDLRVSAFEQLDLLEALMTDELPFEPRHQAAVRDILVREEGDGWQWLHKTGTALSADPTLGWLVGATVHSGRTWVFALNLDLETIGPDGVASQIDPQVRIDLARELLIDSAALPAAAGG